MIFITVGTQKFPFNRLLSGLDALVESGFDKEIFAQSGRSDYLPKNYSFVEYLSKEEFDEHIQKCSVLITHSGVATIIAALKCEKPVIVIPRLAKYGEHVDDHQEEIADVFAEQNFVLKYREGDDWRTLIEQAQSHKFSHYLSKREQVVHTIQDYLNKIAL